MSITNLFACLLVFAIFHLHCQFSNADETPATPNWAIVIHGGAGASPAKLNAAKQARRKAALATALKAGSRILKANGSSLDAVEQVVRILEDSPIFNAGKGAVYNAVGGHELDASIMDGRNLACGAVAGVTTVKNPISLARLVMTNTRHVLLSGEGADQFAAEMKLPLVDKDYFWTPSMRERYQRAVAEEEENKSTVQLHDDHQGTVGVVALDPKGNIAAGTSTGGLAMKKFGRVGDSPIIGAGTYADNRSCGVSCTGIGEEYIRNAVAYRISARMTLTGETVHEAVEFVLKNVLKPGDGGMIAVSRDGDIVFQHNTPGMSYGAADSSGRFEVGLKNN